MRTRRLIQTSSSLPITVAIHAEALGQALVVSLDRHNVDFEAMAIQEWLNDEPLSRGSPTWPPFGPTASALFLPTGCSRPRRLTTGRLSEPRAMARSI